MLVSGIITAIVSKVKDEMEGNVMEKTLSIINPLTPWIANYEKELQVISSKFSYSPFIENSS